MVERVDPPWEDVVLGPVHLDHLAAPLDAVARLEVIRVLDQRLGALSDGRVSNGVAHAVGFEQEPTAQAVAPLNRFDVLEVSNDHGCPLLLVCTGSGICPSSTSSPRKSSTTSR